MQLHGTHTPERRSSVRVKAELRVFYNDYQSKIFTGYSIDLSTGGIFLITTCPFDVDDIVKLKLFPLAEGEKPISCDARVAWINHEDKWLKPEYPTGVGLQFVGLTSAGLSSIKQFLKKEAAK